MSRSRAIHFSGLDRKPFVPNGDRGDPNLLGILNRNEKVARTCLFLPKVPEIQPGRFYFNLYNNLSFETQRKFRIRGVIGIDIDFLVGLPSSTPGVEGRLDVPFPTRGNYLRRNDGGGAASGAGGSLDDEIRRAGILDLEDVFHLLPLPGLAKIEQGLNRGNLRSCLTLCCRLHVLRSFNCLDLRRIGGPQAEISKKQENPKNHRKYTNDLAHHIFLLNLQPYELPRRSVGMRE